MIRIMRNGAGVQRVWDNRKIKSDNDLAESPRDVSHRKFYAKHLEEPISETRSWIISDQWREFASERKWLNYVRSRSSELAASQGGGGFTVYVSLRSIDVNRLIRPLSCRILHLKMAHGGRSSDSLSEERRKSTATSDAIGS